MSRKLYAAHKRHQWSDHAPRRRRRHNSFVYNNFSHAIALNQLSTLYEWDSSSPRAPHSHTQSFILTQPFTSHTRICTIVHAPSHQLRNNVCIVYSNFYNSIVITYVSCACSPLPCDGFALNALNTCRLASGSTSSICPKLFLASMSTEVPRWSPNGRTLWPWSNENCFWSWNRRPR